MIKNAKFSPDKKYRYSLSRIWDDDLPSVVFVGFNPSTADDQEDDPTIKRLIGFSERWGYGSLHVINLMAYVSSDKDKVLEIKDPVGPNNSLIIRMIFRQTNIAKIVPMWGNLPDSVKVDIALIHMNRFLFYRRNIPIEAFGINKSGHPTHPLYLPNDTKLQNYLPELKKLSENLRG